MAIGRYGPCVADHTVIVTDRGGATRIAQIVEVERVKWSRERDAISEAEIWISGGSCSAQRELLAAIEPMRSEIVIYRGSDRVWEGVVWRITDTGSRFTIVAHDIFAYIFRTPLTREWSNAYPNVDTVTGRIQEILEYEMQEWEELDPPVNILPHLQVHHFVNEARTTAVTMPYEMTVGEHIINLGQNAGVDWTVVGRSLHVWDVSRSLGRTKTFTEADFFGDVIVSAYGSDHASRVFVVGEDGVYGSAGEPDGYYGLWTMVLTSYNEEGTALPTQSELDSQAQRNLLGRTPVPVEVRIPDNSSIRLSDSLTIHDLVPGVQVPLRATLNARQISQMQKIDSVTVTEDSSNETIQAVLMPATRPDEDYS